MSVKTERAEIIESDSPMVGHSMNQKKIRINLEGQERLFGRNKKAEKAARHRLKQKKFLENLPCMQLSRALDHMFLGTATPEEVQYFLRHESRFVQAIDKQVTIVDFSSSNGKLSSKS